jgi:hypothetical protein
LEFDGSDPYVFIWTVLKQPLGIRIERLQFQAKQTPLNTEPSEFPSGRMIARVTLGERVVDHPVVLDRKRERVRLFLDRLDRNLTARYHTPWEFGHLVYSDRSRLGRDL